MASPVQTTWVCVHVLHAMGIQGILPPQPTPHERLGDLIQSLLKDRNQWWDCSKPTVSMQVFEKEINQLFGEVIHDDEEGPFHSRAQKHFGHH